MAPAAARSSSSARLLVICPSRARVPNIVNLVDAWQATTAGAELVVCLDEDDPELGDYLAVLHDAPTVRREVWAWRSLCDWVNLMCRMYADEYDIFGQIGDDHHPRTVGWDSAVREAMQPNGVVYCNDLHQGERLPTAAFVDAEIPRRLGYMVPPTIRHLYMDNYFRSLGEALGTLRYLPDVIIEHMHPHAHKAQMDDGYRQVNNRTAYREGKLAFERYVAHQLAEDVDTLTGAAA